MTDDVVADHNSVPNGGRSGPDMTGPRARVGAFLRDGFSLPQVEGFCLTLLRLDTDDTTSTDRQAEYEFVMLSTTGGPVRSSSGIPVWTQRLSTQASQLACIVAFEPVIDAGEPRPPVIVLCSHDAAAAADDTCNAAPANDPEFRAADNALSAALAALDADSGKRDACIGPLHATADPGSAPTLDANVSHRICLSASWLRNNHTKRISIAEAAAVARMSERNFVRRFKQEIGVVPSEFIRRVRLDEACQMLAHSDLPADKIARRTGFSRGNQMARIFRRYLEMSPTEYRHTMRTPVDSAVR
ncbi:AraC family transcriptional regulator [Burkholderia ambifaria]|uniref:helix-turn-helix domain-containing protein n=1 Tax=Burkholderia ambifaria TaxID=152480 RepID=UPI001E30C107|nr:AraC family transcriptional regulator [Burkholderia ambifaria]UEP50886.1 AraC family transcriptional regulator [Burkholderia ambifaria]